MKFFLGGAERPSSEGIFNLRAPEENRRLAEAAYDNGDIEVSHSPEIFAIEGTNHCNIKCIMCPRGEPDIMRRDVGHMDIKTLGIILERASYFSGVCWFHLFGEPLMNPHIYEYIRIAKTKIPNVGLSTNATLLSLDAGRKLLESGLDTLMIAIDGDTKEVYETVRKSTRFSFERVISNAESFLALRSKLGRSKPRVMMSMIVMDMTKSDGQSYKEHWEQLGADQVVFKSYSNWGGQRADLFDDLQLEEIPPSLNRPRRNPCKFLWESVVITWNGDVVPCCYDYDAKMVMGNIMRQSLEEIWNGKAYVELRRAELGGVNSSQLCANCTQAPGRERHPEQPCRLE